ncbi:DUF6323 family protein [Clostridium beijerinckii]|uniref:DUF6323 family protein n=1 Tax=Clostridium beijerinckii TaxID=1520 RepID=UPI001F3059ED|nr:DUF6323 family protein [Clostridium beijerinckii]
MKNYLMSISDSIISKQTFEEILQCNEETVEYGLKLSEENVKEIVEIRSEALSKNGRVEFGGGIIKQIISTFCDSPYISQYNYIETIEELIETFYYYKNETIEEIGDIELINLMKGYFDNECQGSLELLRYKYLDTIAHNIKYGVSDYLNVDGDEEL